MMLNSVRLLRLSAAAGLAGKIASALAIALLALPAPLVAADGLIAEESPYGVAETMDRVEQTVRQRDLNVFARIDHESGAQRAGMELRPTQLIIFGNPQGGTPFMRCAQTVGIDLPLKVLVWEDEDGTTWLGYNDPAWIAERHDATECPIVENLQGALSGIVEDSLSP